jgi:hypothetical protein
MADATYQPLVYRRQGGNVLVVASGGEINVESGGTITAAGTQAANIAAATGGTYSTGVQAKINSIITALEGVGVLATS